MRLLARCYPPAQSTSTVSLAPVTAPFGPQGKQLNQIIGVLSSPWALCAELITAQATLAISLSAPDSKPELLLCCCLESGWGGLWT